jgi:hypothetical protein
MLLPLAERINTAAEEQISAYNLRGYELVRYKLKHI